MTVNRPPELLILVHGTFASTDQPDAWWLPDSSTWNYLISKMPPNAMLDREHSVFRWSGINTESERRKAAELLLDKILEMERKGQRYHLIGHSHGGSVIWHALDMYTEYYIPELTYRSGYKSLPNLRSITTVGTPFMFSEKARDRDFVWLIVLTLIWSIVFGMSPIARSFGEGLTLKIVFTATILMAFMAATLCSVYIAGRMYRRMDRIRVDFNRPNTRLTSICLFGSRWYGIVCATDEAVAILASSLRRHTHILPRLQPPQVTSLIRLASIDFQDTSQSDMVRRARMALISLYLDGKIVQLYNKIFAPNLDKIICAVMRKKVHGFDIPFYRFTGLSTSPCRDVSCNEIEAGLSSKLIEGVNLRMAQAAPLLRKSLCSSLEARYPLIQSMLEGRSAYTGGELVHTSYFLENDIIDVLLSHIAVPVDSISILQPYSGASKPLNVVERSKCDFGTKFYAYCEREENTYILNLIKASEEKRLQRRSANENDPLPTAKTVIKRKIYWHFLAKSGPSRIVRGTRVGEAYFRFAIMPKFALNFIRFRRLVRRKILPKLRSRFFR